MTIFFKASDAELVRLRNEVFRERGMLALIQAGFTQSPFSTGWFGKDNTGGFSYEFCRVGKNSRLDMVLVYIVKGDRWIQVHLNVFRLHPEVSTIEDLKDIDGLAFHLPPNSSFLTRMASRTRSSLFDLSRHKIGAFFSKSGLRQGLDRLGARLEDDLRNIDIYIEKWLSEHDPINVDWSGCPIKKI